MIDKIELMKNALLETKADEAMNTWDGESDGAVSEGFANTIIEKIRDAKSLYSVLNPSFNMPTSKWTIPLEWGDPEFYFTWENGDVPADEYKNSKAGLGNVELNASKLTAITYLSGELDEDSIVGMRTYIQDKLAKSFIKQRDALLINGDKDITATNINTDVVPTGGSYFLAQDGLRKTAIWAGKTVDVWAFELSDIREARSQLKEKGVNPEDLRLVLGYDAYYKLLNLSQVETIEKFGTAATVVNWVLKFVDGIEIVVSWVMWKTLADGTISANTVLNTKGTWVLVHVDSVYTWIRRDMTVFMSYLEERDQYRVTAHARIAQKVLEDWVVALINITV